MRIGVLTTSYPRHPDDWAGRFVAELAGWMAAQGDAVEVMAPEPARTVDRAVVVRPLHYARNPCLFYRAGAPDNLLGDTSLARRTVAWCQVPSFVGRLAAICWRQSRRWQRLLSHWLLPCGVVAGALGRGLPHLAVAHSSDVHLLGQLPAANGLLRVLARPRTALVLTSEALREPLLRLTRSGQPERTLIGEATVVPMGVRAPRSLIHNLSASPGTRLEPPGCVSPPKNTPSIPSSSRLARRSECTHLARSEVVNQAPSGVLERSPRRRARASRLRLVFIGRLITLKGVDLLLEACSGLPVSLVIVGEGPERLALERLARRLALDVPLDVPLDVHFLGEQGREETWRQLTASDVLALPSRVLADGRTDSAPLALMEALVAGVPVIASRVGGVQSLVRDGVEGLTFAPGDVGGLRRALLTFVQDRRRLDEMAAGALERGSTLGWDRAGKQLRDLLLSL